MATFIQPFDLQTIFVTIFAGSWNIFLFLAVIGVSIFAGKYRFPDRVFLMVLVLFAIIMAPQLGGLYALVILVTGLLVYYGTAKLVKQ